MNTYVSVGDYFKFWDFLLQVKRLLDEGMDANFAALGPKSHGLTPLHLVAKGSHIKVMDELLEHGANIDARTKGAYGCKYQLSYSQHRLKNNICLIHSFISLSTKTHTEREKHTLKRTSYSLLEIPLKPSDHTTNSLDLMFQT